MASDVIIKVSADGVQVLSQDFGKAGTAAERLGKKGVFAGASISSGMRTATAGARMLYGMLGGIGAAMAVKKILTFNEQLNRLYVDSGKSAKEMLALKEQMLKMSEASGMPAEEIARGMQVFQDFGGRLDIGIAKMQELVQFSRAYGTSMEDTSKVAATLNKVGVANEDILSSMAMMKAMADAGNESMAAIADVVPKILAAGTAYGFVGKRGVEQLLPLQQLLSGTGASAEETATIINGFMKELKDEKATKVFKKWKWSPFDKGKLKDVDVIMKKIMDKTGGDVKKLGDIFAEMGFKAVVAFKAAGADAEKIFKARKTGKDVGEAFKKTEEGPFGKPSADIDKALAKGNSALQNYGGKAASWIANNPEAAAAIGVGAIGAKMFGPKLIRGAWNMVKNRGKGGAGAALGGLADMAGVQKVFVVNMDGGALGGNGAAAFGDLPAAKAGLFARMMGGAKGLLGLGAVPLGALGAKVGGGALAAGGLMAGAGAVGGALGYGVGTLAAEKIPQWLGGRALSDVFVGTSKKQQTANEMQWEPIRSSLDKLNETLKQPIQIKVKPSGGIDGADMHAARNAGS